jgi:hypothetical protein
MKQIVVGIASLPEREDALLRVVNSLKAQADLIYVALNGYDHVPEGLRSLYNVKCEILDNSLGDSAKFLHVGEFHNFYYFRCDDDLEYPKIHIPYMMCKIKQYNAIVTLHGRKYHRPVTSFKRGFSLNYHCLHSYNYDIELDLGGTGVMAFDTSQFKLSIADFPIKNMADIHVAKKAHEQNIKIMGVEHKNTYLTYLPPKGSTIWQTSGKGDEQTRILREFLK